MASCCSLEVVYGAGALRFCSRLRDLGDAVLRALEIGAHAARGLAVLDLELLAVGPGQARQERDGALPRSATPTFQYSSGMNASISRSRSTISRKRHRLHATRGQAEGELAPDQRGDVVAHDAVEHAPGALGVVEVVVELARMRRAPLLARPSW